MHRTYRFSGFSKSKLVSVDKYDGERLEDKVRRIESTGEPIKDGAPEIFTERNRGVVAAFNIRTDRFDIAGDAMDAIHRSKTGKRAEGVNLDKTETPGEDGGDNPQSEVA